jgi:hypothetical protein
MVPALLMSVINASHHTSLERPEKESKYPKYNFFMV